MTPHGARAGGGASSAERWVVGIAFAAILASLGFLVHPWYELSNDAALYISTARSIAAGEGYRYLDIPFTVRPPGFSLLIAPIVAFAPGSFFALNLFVSLLGVSTAVLLFCHERSRLGWPLALLTTLVLWSNPAFQRLCNTVLSDVPGVAALLASLLVARWCEKQPSRGRDVVLGLAIGVAAYIRTANLLLVGAIALARVLRSPLAGGSRRLALRDGLFAVVACATILPSFVRNELVIPPPPAEQTRLYSYGTALLHVDPGDPSSARFTVGDIVRRAELRVRQVTAVLGGRLGTRVRSSADDPASARRGEEAWRPAQLSNLYALALVAALCIQGVRTRDAACFFALGLLLFLLTYFGFQDRLLLPVYLIAFPATVALAREVAVRLLGLRAGTGLTGAILVALLVVDFAPRSGWTRTEAVHRKLADTASAIEGAVGPHARLAAVTGFNLTMWLDRPVYSLHRAVWRARAGAAIEPIIDKYGIDTVVLDSPSHERPLIEKHLRQNYGNPRSAGEALVWRVRPGERAGYPSAVGPGRDG